MGAAHQESRMTKLLLLVPLLLEELEQFHFVAQVGLLPLALSVLALLQYGYLVDLLLIIRAVPAGCRSCRRARTTNHFEAVFIVIGLGKGVLSLLNVIILLTLMLRFRQVIV